MNQNDKDRFIKASCLMLEKQDELSALDGVFGDGDHGITIGKIANIIKSKSEKSTQDISLKALLDDIGMSILSTSGGSICPLWGSLFIGMSNALTEDDICITVEVFARMLHMGVEEVQTVSSAKIGDKTIMDVLLPVSEKSANFKADSFFKEAAEIAKQSAEYTKQCVAHYGRAKNSKEKSLGYSDPGAVSMAYFFEGLA